MLEKKLNKKLDTYENVFKKPKKAERMHEKKLFLKTNTVRIIKYRIKQIYEKMSLNLPIFGFPC